MPPKEMSSITVTNEDTSGLSTDTIIKTNFPSSRSLNKLPEVLARMLLSWRKSVKTSNSLAESYPNIYKHYGKGLEKILDEFWSILEKNYKVCIFFFFISFIFLCPCSCSLVFTFFLWKMYAFFY